MGFRRKFDLIIACLAVAGLSGLPAEAGQSRQNCERPPQNFSLINEINWQLNRVFLPREVTSNTPDCAGEAQVADQKGIISIYGNEKGKKNACGKPVAYNNGTIDCGALTAAHRTLPFGTKVWIHVGNRTVQVTITDRGPFVKGRIIDVTPKVAQLLGFDDDAGILPVKIEWCSSKPRAMREAKPRAASDGKPRATRSRKPRTRKRRHSTLIRASRSRRLE